MKRRHSLALMGACLGASTLTLAGCASAPAALASPQAQAPVLRGTGDLGAVVARSTGTLAIVNTSSRTLLGQVSGLGDLSHASVVFSRDARYAYVFGRDGALSKVDLLTQEIVGRVVQAGNSIGGAISADGTLVVAQNYTPGGIKVFDAATLQLLADVPIDSLAAVIFHGRPGTPMPPWKAMLSEPEARWIALRLQQGFPEEVVKTP